jgi:hypothetical protein
MYAKQWFAEMANAGADLHQKYCSLVVARSRTATSSKSDTAYHCTCLHCLQKAHSNNKDKKLMKFKKNDIHD